MTVYTTLPTDDLNLAVTVIDDPDLVVLNITPASVNVTSAVTSVNGLTGNVTLDSDDIPEGTTNLYSDQPNSTTDDVTFNSVTADMFGVQHFVAKARETISAGQPVYISGHSGNTPEVMVADYADPAKMPAFGIASTDIADNTNGNISTYGDLKNVDTTGSAEGETWAVGDSLYVNGSKLTNIRPSLDTQEIQKVAKVIRVHAQTGQMFLVGAGRSNDTPNLAHQNVFIGNAGGVERRQLTSADITNSAGYITADSTDTLSNKSGNISQWTNDAGYITSETDNQTLAFTTPNLSISNGNSVDLTTLTTGFITASSTDTLTNKSGSNSQWTNDEGYTTNTGTVTPSSTDTFTNKSGSNNQWTNDAGYITNSALTPYYTSSQVDALPVSTFSNDAGYSTTTGTVTPSSTDTFTNKSGSNSQWTNDEAYLQANALTPYYTSTQVDALPVSTFTNDAGYLTTETDSQTLSFTTPDLTISNGNSVDLTSLKYTDADVDSHLNRNLANPDEVLMWSGTDWAWQTLSTVATSNDYNDLDNLPTIPTQTVINSNADNRIITGSATADNLNGEADFTWDGNNGVIDGTASNLTTPVLNVKTDNSNWFTGQMMLTDSNDDVCTLVGSNRNNFYEYNFTLDPNNTKGRTGATTFAGDYFIAFRKDYTDQANIKMNLTAFGAHGGFDFTVRGDYNNGGGNQYKGKPLNFNCEEANFNLGPDRDVLALTVAEEMIDCKVPIGQARLSSDPANPAGGWTYYNTTTNKLRLYVDGTGWVDLN